LVKKESGMISLVEVDEVEEEDDEEEDDEEDDDDDDGGHLLNLQNLHSILLLGFNLQDQQLRHHHRHQFY
jgi:hypothetical protein